MEDREGMDERFWKVIRKSTMFDGSRLKPGAYYIVALTSKGVRRTFGFVKR